MYSQGLQFTAASSGRLSTIEIAAFREAGGTQVNVSLARDDADQPGSLLETVQIGPFGSSPSIQTAHSIIKPYLYAGTKYWLIVSPISVGDSFGWNRNVTLPPALNVQRTGTNAWITHLDYQGTMRLTSTAVSIVEFPLQMAGSGPLLIAAGPDGNLWFTEYKWFTEYTANKIGRITTGGVITEFPIPTPASQPVGIVAGPDGNLWFTESVGNKIGRITTSGTLTEFPLPTNTGPFGICLGPDGALWFTETAANKIGRITPAGDITEFPLPVDREPWMIAAGPDGNLWFTEFLVNKIGRITPAGIITEFPLPGSRAYCIAAGPDGNVWFTEDGGSNIGRITPAGDITEFPLPSGSALGICLGPDGALWFTGNGKVGRITTSGVVTEFALPTTNAIAEGICLGPDGALWFTEFAGDKIGRLSFPRSYFTLPPCRVLDSRYASPPFFIGGPFGAGGTFQFNVAGTCGIPATAASISVNITVTSPTAPGYLTLYPTDRSRPMSSAVNFSAGQTRANNAILPLALDGTGFTLVNGSAGSVHFILDVNGYFE